MTVHGTWKRNIERKNSVCDQLESPYGHRTVIKKNSKLFKILYLFKLFGF